MLKSGGGAIVNNASIYGLRGLSGYKHLLSENGK